MTIPPYFRTGLRPALALLFLVAAGSLFAADDEDLDEEVEPVVVPPLIESNRNPEYSYDAQEWRDSTIPHRLVAPYRVWQAGKRRMGVEFLRKEDAPKHMTFFGKGPETWIGVRRTLRKTCDRHCDDSVLTDCYWVGEYEVPRAETPEFALAGRIAPREVKVPPFLPAPSDAPECQDSVWGRFRTRICPTAIFLSYDRLPLLRDFVEDNGPLMRMTRAFRYGQIDYYVVEYSSKLQDIQVLLYQTPLGWVILERGLEPPERAEMCC